MFIALEGIDGSGKSTQAQLLVEYLKGLNRNTHLTFEPTNNYIGKTLRNILTHQQTAHEEVIAGLFVADRLDHILNMDYGMQQLLNSGYDVITDRYYLSSYAYNGLHCGQDWVMQANAKAASLLKPNIHFFIDVPVSIALQRVQQNRQTVDLYETEDNLTKVRKLFFEAFEKVKLTESIIIIDGNRASGEIHDEIIYHCQQYL